jgi:hypothetical protein
MGDNINMDWGTLGTAPNPNAFMQGYSNARTIQQNAMADNARTDALANPSDMNALTHLAVFNPQAAEAMRGQLDYQRAGMARQPAPTCSHPMRNSRANRVMAAHRPMQ